MKSSKSIEGVMCRVEGFRVLGFQGFRVLKYWVQGFRVLDVGFWGTLTATRKLPPTLGSSTPHP